MYRQATEASASGSSPSTKLYKLPSRIFDKITKTPSRDDRPSTRSPAAPSGFDHPGEQGPHLHLQQSFSNLSLQDGTAANNYRQLQALIQKVRSGPAGPNHVDGAYNQFHKIKDDCSALCTALLADDPRPFRTPSVATARRDSSLELAHSPLSHLNDQRSSFSGRSLGEAIGPSGTRSTGPGAGLISEAYLTAVRDWKACLETLADSFKVNLADTYKSYERNATPEMVESLFSNDKFRKHAINRMRNASVTKILSADPQFFPRYDIRFRNYGRVKEELIKIRQILQTGESGISPFRKVEEVSIDPSGDTVLEFANLGDLAPPDPVFRFRVSSARIRDTSPVFARMCSGPPHAMEVHEDEDITLLLPPPPSEYICKDGTRAKLFRMVQHETNKEEALQIMLYAAHGRQDMVPREVSFERFVAVAETALRYKCTSPLERVVEREWLPQWMHNGADEMPDGLLVISYVFGLRQLFTRMSKTAILNLVDEDDVRSKSWPPKFKDKIWAVRCAKMDQVYRCCEDAIRDYIQQPTRLPSEDTRPPAYEVRSNFSPAVPPKQPISISSPPRCPRGSRSCDSVNLGWLMLVFHEMNLLRRIMQGNMLAHLPSRQGPSSTSLVKLIDMLRRIPSPDSPVHRGGVCDPIPTLRSAMTDILKSVTGLTLHDISGKSHGWGLSKHRKLEPQVLLTQDFDRMAASRDHHSVVTEFPEMIRLRILGEFSDLAHLHAVARVNKAFYDTFKVHELYLMRNILRADRRRADTMTVKPISARNMEEKVKTDEADVMKEMHTGLGRDATTLHSYYGSEAGGDSEDDESSSEASIYDAPERRRPLSGRRTSSTIRSGHSQTSSDATNSLGAPSGGLAGGAPTLIHEVAHHRQDSNGHAKPTFEHEEVMTPLRAPPMTDEEAREILWRGLHGSDGRGGGGATRPSLRMMKPGMEPMAEKFLQGDSMFLEVLQTRQSGEGSDLHHV